MMYHKSMCLSCFLIFLFPCLFLPYPFSLFFPPFIFVAYPLFFLIASNFIVSPLFPPFFFTHFSFLISICCLCAPCFYFCHIPFSFLMTPIYTVSSFLLFSLSSFFHFAHFLMCSLFPLPPYPDRCLFDLFSSPYLTMVDSQAPDVRGFQGASGQAI